MGRGRAKAKQTKVARELKYNTRGPDLDRLRDELLGKPAGGEPDDGSEESGESDEGEDPYADDEDETA